MTTRNFDQTGYIFQPMEKHSPCSCLFVQPPKHFRPNYTQIYFCWEIQSSKNILKFTEDAYMFLSLLSVLVCAFIWFWYQKTRFSFSCSKKTNWPLSIILWQSNYICLCVCSQNGTSQFKGKLSGEGKLWATVRNILLMEKPSSDNSIFRFKGGNFISHFY